MRTGLSVALCAIGLRVVFFVVIALSATVWPESVMGLLLDRPTLAVYDVLASFGYSRPVGGAYDLRFLLLGVAVWGIIGLAAGLSWRAMSGPPKQTEKESPP